MARRFGSVRELPSGRFQASFVAPDGFRVNALVTFASRTDAESWLTTQHSDIIRGTWKARRSRAGDLARLRGQVAGRAH